MEECFNSATLRYIINTIITRVRKSPIDMKAFCLAASYTTDAPQPHLHAKLASLCDKISAQTKGRWMTSSITASVGYAHCGEEESVLIKALLGCPKRHADKLLCEIEEQPLISEEKLKKDLWFPIGELIRVCFANSGVETSYTLEEAKIDRQVSGGSTNTQQPKSKDKQTAPAAAKQSLKDSTSRVVVLLEKIVSSKQ